MAAIAAPHFRNAQLRTKLAKVESDMKSIGGEYNRGNFKIGLSPGEIKTYGSGS